MLKRWMQALRGKPPEEAPVKMIVGLGNPGQRYEKNRHNVGFQCLDLLAEVHGLRFDVSKGKARIALGNVQPGPSVEMSRGEEPLAPHLAMSVPGVAAVRVLLAKPQTFMNEAGQSVASLARFYKIEPAAILIIYDELDLRLGQIRLRPGGGSGGHNGVKSIIRALGVDGFHRLRVGIDRPPGRMDPADYVLQDFSPEQEEVMVQVRPQVVAACETWLEHGIEAAMNAFN